MQETGSLPAAWTCCRPQYDSVALCAAVSFPTLFGFWLRVAHVCGSGSDFLALCRLFDHHGVFVAVALMFDLTLRLTSLSACILDVWLTEMFWQ